MNREDIEKMVSNFNLISERKNQIIFIGRFNKIFKINTKTDEVSLNEAGLREFLVGKDVNKLKKLKVNKLR